MDRKTARQMLNLIPLAYFRLQNAADQLHAARRISTGLRGLMISLDELGPTTAVRLADMRPVSRQAIHKLAQQLLKRQLIRQIVNPDDGRAPLLELTAKGHTELKLLRKLEEPGIDALTQGLTATDIERTTRTIETLCARLAVPVDHGSSVNRKSRTRQA